MTDGVPLTLRCFEIVVSATVLIISVPVLAVIATIVKWGTPGPALFFQARLGRNGKPFRFVKFRTLYADAKKRFPDLYAYQYSDRELQDLKFKVDKDPRVTPQGVWLRRSSFDELPNFWNVVKGDMALVGPRPEIPEMLPYYKGEMLLKFSVRPGITGLAQISGRGRLGFFETVAYDVEYAKNHTLWLDLRIILKTIWMVFVRDGAF
ncbi:MAG: sugar transferase [Candidatus Acidiferrum sp.]